MSEFLVLKHNPETDQFVAVAKIQAKDSAEAIDKIGEPGRFDVFGILVERRVRITARTRWNVEFVPDSEV